MSFCVGFTNQLTNLWAILYYANHKTLSQRIPMLAQLHSIIIIIIIIIIVVVIVIIIIIITDRL
jgi:heme/copper-type cytochrome/quinol oxidase subunit 2